MKWVVLAMCLDPRIVTVVASFHVVYLISYNLFIVVAVVLIIIIIIIIIIKEKTY